MDDPSDEVIRLLRELSSKRQTTELEQGRRLDYLYSRIGSMEERQSRLAPIEERQEQIETSLDSYRKLVMDGDQRLLQSQRQFDDRTEIILRDFEKLNRDNQKFTAGVQDGLRHWFEEREKEEIDLAELVNTVLSEFRQVVTSRLDEQGRLTKDRLAAQDKVMDTRLAVQDKKIDETSAERVAKIGSVERRQIALFVLLGTIGTSLIVQVVGPLLTTLLKVHP